MTTCECFIQNSPHQPRTKEIRYETGVPKKSKEGKDVRPTIITPGSPHVIMLDHGASEDSPVDIFFFPFGDKEKRILVRSLFPGETTSWTGPDLRTRTLVHSGSMRNPPRDNLEKIRDLIKTQYHFEGFK